MTGTKNGCEGLLGGLRKAGRRTLVGVAGAHAGRCSERIQPSRHHAELASMNVASNDQCRARHPVTNGQIIGAYSLLNQRSIFETMTLEGVNRLGLQALRNRFHGVEDILAVQSLVGDDALRRRGVVDRVRSIVDISRRTLPVR